MKKNLKRTFIYFRPAALATHFSFPNWFYFISSPLQNNYSRILFFKPQNPQKNLQNSDFSSKKIPRLHFRLHFRIWTSNRIMERDEKEFQDVCGLNLTMIKYFFPSSTLSCTSLIRFIWCGFSKSTLFIICNTHNTIRSSIFWDNPKIRTEELNKKMRSAHNFTWKSHGKN